MVYMILFIGLNFNALSQNNRYNFQKLSLNEGLSQSTVFCTTQDKNGFIWIGTRTGGLNKYDGYSFDHYIKNPDDSTSISGNEIICLLEDSKGNLWVGTNSDGLNSFDYTSEKFKRFYSEGQSPNTLNQKSIKDLIEDENGLIWIATEEGLFTLNPSEESFSEVSNSLLKTTHYGFVSDLSLGKKGELIVGASQGLFVVDINSRLTKKVFDHTIFNQSSDDISNRIKDILYDDKGNIWYGTHRNGLYQITDFDNNEAQLYSAEEGYNISSTFIRTIDQDSNGNIWIGTNQGLNLLKHHESANDQPEFIHIQSNETDNKSLSQNSIYCFDEDNKGNFWIGTWSGGLNYLHNEKQKFDHYKHLFNVDSSLSNNSVTSFCANDKGIWVGTAYGGLNLFDPQKGTFSSYQQSSYAHKGLNSDHMKALTIDGKDNFWIGTYQGLLLFDDDKGSFETILDNTTINCITEGNDNDIWIGTSTLLKLDNVTKKYQSYPHNPDNLTSLSSGAINCIFKDSQDNIWIGTSYGLNKYIPSLDQFERYIHDKNNPNSLSHYNITTINEDLNGNIWVGTLGGLNRLKEDKKSFERYDQRHGLPDNSISNLVIDDSGVFWVTTNKGMSKISFSIDFENMSIRNYDIYDGLQDYEFSTNSSYKDDQGNIYIGGINGFNHFAPTEVKDNQEIPNIIVTHFKLDNKEVSIDDINSPLDRHISETDSITLTHKQTDIIFEFVALNYTSPEKNQYAYMMEGYDSEWKQSGNRRQAYYTNLPSGQYTFRVKGSNNDNIWNEKGASIYLNILPAWYNTWWFRTIVILIIVSSIIYFNIWKSKKHKKDKEKLNDQINNATKQVIAQNAELETQKNSLLKAVSEINLVVSEAVESGNFKARINLDGMDGEWKNLGVSVNKMFESVLKPFSEINRIVDGMASGDLSKRYTDEAKGDVALLSTNLNSALDSLSDLLSNLKEQIASIGSSTDDMTHTTEEINNSTSEIASAIAQMSSGAQQQVANVDQSSNIIEGILKFSSDMKRQAFEINEATKIGVEKSQAGMQQMGTLDTQMKDILSYSAETTEAIKILTQRSNDINAVLRIIEDVASQTNLLALNAAIEAAQAGDAGRGFAVVAEEIRKLAEDSKVSTSKIQKLISGVQTVTSSTASLVSKMSSRITEGSEATKHSLSAFQDISTGYEDTLKKSENIVTATNQQTNDLGNVVNMMDEIVVIAEETAAGTEQTASSATQLSAGMENHLQKSKEVSSITYVLRSEVDKFKL
ncbi:hypothetical protein BGP76_12560 [Reichenbachiella sp. MSK19-1]|nr:hypothetical protein BGP76_12560 [Reichenbachiella sp. MSK19-1]